MKFAALAAFVAAVFLGGCSTKIYEDSAVTCTWQKVEELIICRGDQP